MSVPATSPGPPGRSPLTQAGRGPDLAGLVRRGRGGPAGGRGPHHGVARRARARLNAPTTDIDKLLPALANRLREGAPAEAALAPGPADGGYRYVMETLAHEISRSGRMRAAAGQTPRPGPGTRFGASRQAGRAGHRSPGPRRLTRRIGGKDLPGRRADPAIGMNAMNHDLQWLLENLLTRTPQTRHALVLSRDGLKLCHTSSLTPDKADQLAAIASGIQSLSYGASMEFGDGTGGVRQSMTEFHGGLLFIVAAGEGAHLAVVADDDADVGLIGHTMNELVEQLGDYLTAAPRQPASLA